ncbi:MAG: AbrB family transcriptional regulator [Cucumibacter sp.]
MNLAAGAKAAWPAGLALGLSLLGGLAAEALGLPAGWLVGGSAVVTVAALLGVPLAMPAPLRDAGFILVGLSMGSSVARDTLALIGQWPITMAALAVSLALIVGATGWVLTTRLGFDKRTALLASTPGHSSFIQGLALSGLGDARQIAVVQSIRILTLVIAVPLFVAVSAPSALVPVADPAPMDWLTLAWLAPVCALAGWIAIRLKVPAGFVIGAMAASTAARLGGLSEGAAPWFVVIPGFLVIAALIGSRFAGVTGDLLRRSLAGGLVATVLAVAISGSAAWVASLFVDFSFSEIWIAIAPGGLESMAGMGMALGYDPAFVVTHHAARLFMLALAMPMLMVAMRPPPEPRGR